MTNHVASWKLSVIHSARKIAEKIVHTQATLLKELYTNLETPETFESIGSKVWPIEEPKPSKVKFVRTVIYMALQEIFTQDFIKDINEKRSQYFWSKLWNTIKKNGWEKTIEKIRFLAGKKNWKNNAEKLRKLYKERLAKKWCAVWYADEVSFLDAMLQDPSFYHKAWWNKWELDYTKIVPLLNKHFHNNVAVRNGRGVSNYLYKRARCNWTEQELDYLQLVWPHADLQLVASYLNELCHEWVCIRTPQSIAFVLDKMEKELQKKKKLGIV